VVKEKGLQRAAEEVDVVDYWDFRPDVFFRCLLNIGHSKPRIKLGGGRSYLNDVPAYTGLAAVDLFLGATAMPEDDPRNKVHPGELTTAAGTLSKN